MSLNATDHTFYVIEEHSNGRALIAQLPSGVVRTPEGEPIELDSSNLRSTVVKVISLRPTMGLFAPEELQSAWPAIAVPGNVRVRVTQRPTFIEFWDSSLLVEGKPQRSQVPQTSLMDSVIEHACGVNELIVLDAIPSELSSCFITTQKDRHYVVVECQVKLKIAYWGDVPRCFDSYDEVFRGYSPAFGAHESDVERHIGSMVKHSRDQARSRFRDYAQQLRLESGSLLPCSLWSDVLNESECVVEIVQDISDLEKVCRLHILSQNESLSVLRGTVLRLTSSSWDAEQSKHRPIVRELGSVV